MRAFVIALVTKDSDKRDPSWIFRHVNSEKLLESTQRKKVALRNEQN